MKIDPQRTVHLWFNLSQEWQGDERADLIRQYVRCEDHQKAIHQLEIQRDFVDWKSRMEAFCRRLADLIKKSGIRVIYYHEVYGSDRILAQDLLLNRK